MSTPPHEQGVDALTGCCLEQVWYIEHAYPSHRPLWGENPDFDTIDHEILLVTLQGVFTLRRGERLRRSGLVVTGGSDTLPERCRHWEVSRESRWGGVLGQPIRHVHTFWSWYEEDRDRIFFPEVLMLDFGPAERVYVTVRDARAEEEDRPVVEQLSVFFDEDTARRYQVGPYAGRSFQF